MPKEALHVDRLDSESPQWITIGDEFSLCVWSSFVPTLKFSIWTFGFLLNFLRNFLETFQRRGLRALQAAEIIAMVAPPTAGCICIFRLNFHLSTEFSTCLTCPFKLVEVHFTGLLVNPDQWFRSSSLLDCPSLRVGESHLNSVGQLRRRFLFNMLSCGGRNPSLCVRYCQMFSQTIQKGDSTNRFRSVSCKRFFEDAGLSV